MASKVQMIQGLIDKLYNAIQDKTNEICDSNRKKAKLYQNYIKGSSFTKEISRSESMFFKDSNGYIIECNSNSITFYKEKHNMPIYSVNIYKTGKKYTGWMDISGEYYDFNNQSDYKFIENKVTEILTILNNQDLKIDEERIKEELKKAGKVPSSESKIEEKLRRYIFSLFGYRLENDELLDDSDTKTYCHRITRAKTNSDLSLEEYTIKSDFLDAVYRVDYYLNKITLEINSNIEGKISKSVIMEKGIISNKEGIVVRLTGDKSKALFAIDNDGFKISSNTKNGRSRTINFSENTLLLNDSSDNYIDSLNICLDENGYKVTIPNKNINVFYSKDSNLFRELLLYPEIKNYILSILELFNKELKTCNNLDGIVEIIYKTFPEFKMLLDEEYRDNPKINNIIELALKDKTYDYAKIKARVDDIASRKTSSIAREYVLNKILEEVRDGNLSSNIKDELINYIENSKQNLRTNSAKKKKRSIKYK